jgi:hypothetical protein
MICEYRMFHSEPLWVINDQTGAWRTEQCHGLLRCLRARLRNGGRYSGDRKHRELLSPRAVLVSQHAYRKSKFITAHHLSESNKLKRHRSV